MAAYTEADVYVYRVAEKLGMSPGQVLDSHTSAELHAWSLLWTYDRAEEERHRLEQRSMEQARSMR